MPYRLSLHNKILLSTQSNAVLRSINIAIASSFDQIILEYHQKISIEQSTLLVCLIIQMLNEEKSFMAVTPETSSNNRSSFACGIMQL